MPKPSVPRPLPGGGYVQGPPRPKGARKAPRPQQGPDILGALQAGVGVGLTLARPLARRTVPGLIAGMVADHVIPSRVEVMDRFGMLPKYQTGVLAKPRPKKAGARVRRPGVYR